MLLADAFVTGWHATELAAVRAGGTVAVFGAGAVGLLAAYSALLKGAAEVYVVDGVPERLDNLVLLGLAAARPSGELAAHTALAFAGYVTGAALGTRIAGPPRPREQTWPVAVTMTLVVELAVMGGFSTGWELAHAQPTGGPQLVPLALATLGMGLHSAAVRGLDTTVSTTSLTGTLTGVIASLVTQPRSRHLDHRGVAVLTTVALGAAVGEVLTLTAPALLPALPSAILTILITTAAYHHTPQTGTARSRP